MSKLLMQSALALLLCAALSANAAPGVQKTDPGKYPDTAGTEYEQSIITIPLYAKGKSEPVEILKLTAFMRLERELPRRNGLGHRQLEFTIADWELYGYSKYLDSDVTFKLSDVPVQPKSLVVSLTEAADYPAMIVYNAIYDIYIGRKLVAKNRPGVAFAKNVYEIPPRNISVAFSKPFTLQAADAKAIGGKAQIATSGVEFSDGTCEDMTQIPQSEFEEGLQISRAIRAGTYTLMPSK